MSWRVARSLEVLLDEVNAHAPSRSKQSDGSIGDAAHSARRSDHNPDSAGVVRARDFTHDPTGGLSGHDLAERLRRSRDPRIKYVIWWGRMFSSYANERRDSWEWGNYSGSNQHRHHLHVSVVAGDEADDAVSWDLWQPEPEPEEDLDVSSFYFRHLDHDAVWLCGSGPPINVPDSSAIDPNRPFVQSRHEGTTRDIEHYSGRSRDEWDLE